MEVQLSLRPRGRRAEQWRQLLHSAGLQADEAVERTVLVYEGDRLVATGSRQDNILKCIAVEEASQGQGLTATVLTALRTDALSAGLEQLFLYTKPQNLQQFSSLFFYPVAQTDEVLLMEDRPDGIRRFLDALPPRPTGTVGAAVMNCNPFTRGHRYLIETAAGECDRLFVFVLSEDRSEFSARDRLEMVRLGTRDLTNVTVLPTGPYLLSAATFPTYFLKDRDRATDVQCALDIAVFTTHFAPRLGITRRYVGTEPLSPLTERYNRALCRLLPPAGIAVRELPRLQTGGQPISASAVRALLQGGQTPQLQALLPQTTIDYIFGRK